MDSKLKKSKQAIIYLYLCGNWLVFIGLLKGKDIATSIGSSMAGISNPYETTAGMVLGCTLIPVILGISLITISIIILIVIFIHWYNKPGKTE